MRALGVERLVVQGILNHKDRSVTAVYDRSALLGFFGSMRGGASDATAGEEGWTG